MPSFQAAMIKWFLKIQPFKWDKVSVKRQKLWQDKAIRKFPTFHHEKLERIQVNGISAAWISCPEPKLGVMLYLHGGAFALGSVNTHAEFLGRLSSATGIKVLAINYRLAPEHPFPAALQDALSAYHWLLSAGWEPSQVVIAGDSAGGGLVLSTMLSLRDAGEVLPCCGVCLSPWVDLTLSSPSIRSKAGADPILNPDTLVNYADLYAGDTDNNNPLISPVFADLEGLPPLLIQVGTDEILLDEATELANKAKAAGVNVELKIWDGLFHVFQLVSFLPETRQSLTQVAAFIERHLSTGAR